jgi:NADPH:quinone reductase-like Zn-dependent oxidoreductase
MSISTTPLEPATVTGAEAPMRAVVQLAYGSPEVFTIGRIARPRPGPREVLVGVRAAALDRGTWHLMTGRPYLMRLMGFGFRVPRQPVPGLDLSGTIIEVGAEVTRFKVGDDVFGLGRGSFAELAVADEDKLSHKPASLSFDEAAALGVSGMTALQALTDAGGLSRGERVLVVGASGGFGTFAVQIAKALGAHVTAVCSATKAELVRSLGADEFIDYRAGDFTARGEQWDLVLDGGGGLPIGRLRRTLTRAGRLVFVGNEHGNDWTGGFERPLLTFLIAPFVQQRFAMLVSKEHFTSLDQLRLLADEGKLRPVIDRRVPIEGVAAAMLDLEQGKVRGKVVVQPKS